MGYSSDHFVEGDWSKHKYDLPFISLGGGCTEQGVIINHMFPFFPLKTGGSNV